MSPLVESDRQKQPGEPFFQYEREEAKLRQEIKTKGPAALLDRNSPFDSIWLFFVIPAPEQALGLRFSRQ